MKTKITFTTPSFEDCKRRKNVGELSRVYGPFEDVRLIYTSIHVDDTGNPLATIKNAWWTAPDGKRYSDVNFH